MFDRPQSGERAILVYVHPPGGYCPYQLAEFGQLATSAGALVASTICASPRRVDPRFLLGSGKIEEIAQETIDARAELILVNAPLSPAQERNLEQRLKCRVLDRIGLILDLFAQRASTFEGQLQVELAQLRHLSTRLVRGWTHLERQKGGIGLRGPGEKQLETDRRLVAGRIRRIESRLAAVGRRRGLGRRARERAGVPVVSLVGYTNAGKSTLFNALTGAGVLTEDRLFATLDPTVRRVSGPNGGNFLLADTVGFISDLPHELVAAFRSTLEETINASLLLHVIDVSDPEWRTRVEQVNGVLESIGAGTVPQLEVFNKVDRLSAGGELPVISPVETVQEARPGRIWVSAISGSGLPELGAAIEVQLAGEALDLKLKIPFAAGGLRAALFEQAKVVTESACCEDGWQLDVRVSPVVATRLRNKFSLDEFVLEEAGTGPES